MDIIKLASEVRTQCKADNDFSDNPIDTELSVIPPYRGKGEIKLIVIGQDPTIKNEKSRSKIKVTLNLDVENSLRRYIDKICLEMGITIDNVYATNMFKYFYKHSPAKTKEILKAHLKPNLELLQQELLEFKNVTIITLGEPLLQLLTNDQTNLINFWNCNLINEKNESSFKMSYAAENKLGLDFYPFPHQPSMSKEFYMNTIELYIKWLRLNSNI